MIIFHDKYRKSNMLILNNYNSESKIESSFYNSI